MVSCLSSAALCENVKHLKPRVALLQRCVANGWLPADADKKTSCCTGTVWVKLNVCIICSPEVSSEKGLWIQFQLTRLLGFASQPLCGGGDPLRPQRNHFKSFETEALCRFIQQGVVNQLADSSHDPSCAAASRDEVDNVPGFNSFSLCLNSYFIHRNSLEFMASGLSRRRSNDPLL